MSARLPAWRRPKARKRGQLEGSIEESCRKAALELGWTSRKMNGFGFRAWPDRLFLPPRRFVNAARSKKPSAYACSRFWVEFKKLGETATEEQARMHKELRERGETVYVCDSKESFLNALENHSAPR